MCKNTQESGRYCAKCGSPVDEIEKLEEQITPIKQNDDFEIEKPNILKYIIYALIVVIVALIAFIVIQLASAGKDNKNLQNVTETLKAADVTTSNRYNSGVDITDAVETTAVPTQIQYSGMEGIIQELLNKNFEFISFHQFGTLDTIGNRNPNTNLYLVSDSRFPTYASYVQYVQEIYSSKRVRNIIEVDLKYWGPDGDSGSLYVYPENMTIAESNTITWDIYTIELTSQDSTSCSFIATDVYSGYSVAGKIVLENGKWLLESEVY